MTELSYYRYHLISILNAMDDEFIKPPEKTIFQTGIFTSVYLSGFDSIWIAKTSIPLTHTFGLEMD
jgi:hypothetical protein